MNDLSSRRPEGRVRVGNIDVRTGYFPLLHALKVRLLATPVRSALVFRVGGPGGGPKVFDRERVRDGLSFDRDDFLGLWYHTAAHFFAPAELRSLQRGETVDPHRRNVLDKIEQSWMEQRWHPTAFEALLYHAFSTTPAEFMARRGARLPDDIPRGENRLPPVGARLPPPSRDGLWAIYPRETQTTRTFVFAYRACVDDSADELSMRVGGLLREYGEPIGRLPRITRELDIAGLCLSRVAVVWPFRITMPTLVPPMLLASAFRTILDDQRAVITLTEYSEAVHGSPEFWQSGRASQTATRDGAAIVAPENPVGPDSARPRGAFERLIEASEHGLPIGALALLGGVAVGVGVASIKRP